MVAQVGNHAKTGIVNQVRAKVVTESFEYRGDYQRKSHYVPCVMQVHEMVNNDSQIEMPSAIGKPESDGTLGRVRSQNLVEYGLEEQGAKGVKHADQRQQQHARDPLQRVREPITQKAQQILHAA